MSLLHFELDKQNNMTDPNQTPPRKKSNSSKKSAQKPPRNNATTNGFRNGVRNH